jgi:hypothetical protein
MNFRLGQIPQVRLGPLDREKYVIDSPGDEHPRLVLSEIRVPPVVEGQIRLIVMKQVDLNGVVSRPIQKHLVDVVGVGTDLRFIFTPLTY